MSHAPVWCLTTYPESARSRRTDRQDGYKGHVAVEPDTGLFTDGRLTQASGAHNHEAVIGLDLLTSQHGQWEVLGDSAYGTGDARAALHDAGHTAVIKPGPLTLHHQQDRPRIDPAST